jgi:hypothetical protein
MSDSSQTPAPDDSRLDRAVLGYWGSPGISARTSLTIAAGAACLIFAIGAQQFGLPILPGFDGSVLAQPASLVALVVIAMMLAGSTLVGTIIARTVHFEAGLFSAAFGLMVLSLRCGTIQSVLFESGGSQMVYLRLVFELILLGAILVGIWFALCKFQGLQAPDKEEPSTVNNLTATLAQTASTAVFILLFCQSEAKNQCLASVGLASLIGSMLAYKYAPTRPSIWYWIGPLIVGVIGYALAALGQDANLNIGLPSGTFAALARPLPLDYASVGVAGAIMGYWMMTKQEAENGDLSAAQSSTS